MAAVRRLALAFALVAAAAAYAPLSASAATYIPATPASLCSGAGTAAGECDQIRGVAVDQSNGNIFAVDTEFGALQGNHRIDEFASDGSFIKAFGVGVLDGASTPQVCTSSCRGGLAINGGPGQVTTGATAIAVDPETHIVYFASGETEATRAVVYYDGETGAYLGEFNGTTLGTDAGSQAPVALSRIRGVAIDTSDPAQHYLYAAFGEGANSAIDKFRVPVVSGGTVTTLPSYVCQITGAEPGSATECATTSSKDGTFNSISLTGQEGSDVAVDSSGNVFVAEEAARAVVSIFNTAGEFVRALPATAPVAVTATTAGHIFVAGGGTASKPTKVQELDISNGAVISDVPITGQSQGIATYEDATGVKGRLYLGDRERGNVWAYRELIEVAPGAEIKAPSNLAGTSAQLNGVVTIPTHEGEGVPSSYRFEYSADGGNSWEATPESSAGESPGPQTVSQQVTGLATNSSYQVRLCATTFPGSACENSSVTAVSPTISLTTATAPPLVSEVRASQATQNSVELEARINPNGSATTYRFEWGQTPLYGTKVPAEFEPFAGSGHESIRATATVTGLSAGSTYFFRVVATNLAGTTPVAGELETLNACGLPVGRCFEMVSPKELGPVAAPGRKTGNREILFQAAASPGNLVYDIEVGLPDATRSAEVLYHASRGADGWNSTEYSPPLVAYGGNEHAGTSSTPNQFFGISPELDCAVVVSGPPLTDDPSSRLIAEAGGANLYRRNPDGSYTLLTARPPEILTPFGFSFEEEFHLVGMTDDCSRIVFNSRYHYPGVPGAGSERLYEWSEEDGLKNVGMISNGTEEIPVEATGGAVSGNSQLNAVSSDGSRVVFSATRLVAGEPGNSGEVGKTGVFVREDGAVTHDVSASETAISDTGATYQGATPDGSHVYFTANAGLTTESSSSGTDLYEYDFGKPQGSRLIDLSVDHEPGGASVGGATNGSGFGALVGLADDGAHVYFIARGQLVRGEGRTLTENQTSNTFSLYDYSRVTGAVSYVGVVGGGQEELSRVTLGEQGTWTSRVAGNGRYLLFESTQDNTAYQSEGRPQVYLYDANDSGAEATVCVSCRQDGRVSVGALSWVTSQAKLASGARLGVNELYAPQTLVMRAGRPRVFFTSADKLATGARDGEANLYEWAHGQVFHITTEAVGQSTPATESSGAMYFAGASTSGTDLYFFNPVALNWENPHGRYAAWDARVGGGFPEPPPTPEACTPTGEGSCQAPAAAPPGSPAAGTASFVGSGNVKAKPRHKRHRKHHHRRHGKKHHGKKHGKKNGKKHHGKRQQRHANGNRRAGK